MHLFITANILTKLMWAQVKGYIVGGGSLFKTAKERLVQEGTVCLSFVKGRMYPSHGDCRKRILERKSCWAI